MTNLCWKDQAQTRDQIDYRRNSRMFPFSGILGVKGCLQYHFNAIDACPREKAHLLPPFGRGLGGSEDSDTGIGVTEEVNENFRPFLPQRWINSGLR
jgi:hypothetical protein